MKTKRDMPYQIGRQPEPKGWRYCLFKRLTHGDDEQWIELTGWHSSNQPVAPEWMRKAQARLNTTTVEWF